MKIQHITPLILLAGCYASNAQTTNAPSNTNTPSLLTKSQAETIALKLADDKVEEERKRGDYDGYPPSPLFQHNLNMTNPVCSGQPTKIQTQNSGAHWHITSSTMDAHHIYHAKVELAADGSTNAVILDMERFPDF